MSKIKIIKFPVGSDPLVLEIDDSLKSLQEQVGGLIQIVHVRGLDLVCNDEGLLLDMDYNRTVDGHRIHGDFFLCRHNDEGETVSVQPEDIRALLWKADE